MIVLGMPLSTVHDDGLACLLLKREALIRAISALERLQISYSVLIPTPNHQKPTVRPIQPPE